MTLVIKASNVNEAVALSLPLLVANGEAEMTRNGVCLVSPGPVMTEYMNPCERVLFSPLRDANPFFHLMEGLWMLAGRNDIAWPASFASRMFTFSDDGVTQHGAYGYRWRNWFEMDQLSLLIEELRKNPNTRRAVLAMWSPLGDLVPRVTLRNAEPNNFSDTRRMADYTGGLNGKDVPCNTHIYFDRRNTVLNMTVCCRSNDAIWGAYGANAVHFSMMQEYVAAALQVPVGVYRQFSNNFHAYLEHYDEDKLMAIARDADETNFYAMESVEPLPMVTRPINEWNDALSLFMEDPGTRRDYSEPFFTHVASPMYRAWRDRKEKISDGYAIAEEIVAQDWRLAAIKWISRRNKEKKNERAA